MTLLKDLTIYAIKVDLYMWDDEKGEYTEPNFVTISHPPMNVLTLEREIKENLRIFNRYSEAVKYICSHESLKNPMFGENTRVVKIRYNFAEQKWEEI